MKIVLNAISISAGGGVRKCLSFIESAAAHPDLKQTIVMAVKGSASHLAGARAGLRCEVVEAGRSARLLHELRPRRDLEEYRLVFNIGGTTPLVSFRSRIHVTEFAFSNIVHPEIDFWNFERGVGRFRKRLKDYYRSWSATRSDYLIFQTPLMQMRGSECLGIPIERTFCIPPSTSHSLDPGVCKSEEVRRWKSIFSNSWVLLYVMGEQRHKRPEALLPVLRLLRNQGYPIALALTVSRNSQFARELYARSTEWGIEDALIFVGPHYGDDLANIISAADCVVNVATLESFSNNLVEAWKFDKPLLLVDAEWARSSAGDAALYIPLDQPHIAAAEIKGLIDSPELEANLRSAGRLRLDQVHQDPSSKLCAYLSVFDRALTAERRASA